MISQADLQVISTVFGKSTDELSGALSSEKEEPLGLRLPGRILTQEQEKELRESGVQQGRELGYKDIAKGLGLTLDSGEKDAIKIAEKFKTTLSTEFEEKFKNMTPTEELQKSLAKINDWETKYSKLNETYEGAQAKIGEWETKYNTLQSENDNKEINNNILSVLPEKLKIDKVDALLIIRSIIKPEKTDAGIIYKRDGNTITNAVGNPETLDNIVKSLVDEKKWIRGAGMNGDDLEDDKNKKKGMSKDDAYKYIVSKGIQPGGTEGLKLFSELTKK